MEFKDRLKALRKAAGLTQAELARQSGVSYSYITKLEIGEQSNPTCETLAALSRVLNAPLGTVYDGETSQEKETTDMREWLRTMRKKAGLSQAEMAARLSIAPSYYQMIERGERQRDMAYSIMEGISSALSCPVQTIINAETGTPCAPEKDRRIVLKAKSADKCVGVIRLTPEAEKVVRRLQNCSGLPICQLVSEIIIQSENLIDIDHSGVSEPD